MPVVTDPTILAQLNGTAPPAPTSAVPASIPHVVVRGATPIVAPTATPVTDPAILAQLNAPDAPIAAPADNAAAATAYSPSAVPWLDQADAFANSAIDAVPIAGPWLTKGADYLDSVTNNLLAPILGLNQQSPSDYAAIDQGEQAQFPVASGAGAVAGTLAPYMLGGALLPTAGKVALGLEGSLPTQILAGGLSSAGIGTADALARGENPTDAAYTGLSDAAMGAAAPVAGRVMGQVLGGIGAPVARTLDQLRAAKTAAYDAVDNSGIRFSPQAYRQMVVDIAGKAYGDNLNADLHPRAMALLKDMAQKAQKGASPTLTQLDQLRQQVARDVGTSTDAEGHFGRLMQGGIDNFIDTAGPQHLVSGNPAQAAQLIKDARSANVRFRRTEEIQNALMKAERRAASTGSGGNVDNAMRQNIRGILDKGARGYSEVEKALMEKIVRGTPIQNVLRLAGKASPEGNGLIGLLELFAAGHDLRAAALPAGGFIAKRAADAMTEGRARLLEAMVSQGTKTPPLKNPVAKALLDRAMAGTPMLENRTGDPGPVTKALFEAVAAQ